MRMLWVGLIDCQKISAKGFEAIVTAIIEV